MLWANEMLPRSVMSRRPFSKLMDEEVMAAQLQQLEQGLQGFLGDDLIHLYEHIQGIVQSIYGKKTFNPQKIATKGFSTDSVSIGCTL